VAIEKGDTWTSLEAGGFFEISCPKEGRRGWFLPILLPGDKSTTGHCTRLVMRNGLLRDWPVEKQ
jgi:hypothetical protein